MLPIASAPRLTFANRLRGALSFWHATFVVAAGTQRAGLQARLDAAALALNREIDLSAVFGEERLALESRRWLDARVDPGFAAAFALVAASVVMLLALVSANLALLMLARVEARRPELAMRVALGAGRLRMIATLGYELLWIGGTGALLGLAIARGLLLGLQGFSSLVQPGPAATGGTHLGLPTLAFSALLCIGVLALVAIGPGRLALKLSSQGANARNDPPGASARRRLIAGGQVFLATLLLIAAGLGVSASWRAVQAPLGFEPERVLTARVALPAALVPADGVTGFLARVQATLAQSPAVAHSGVANCLPARDGCDRVMLELEGGDDTPRPVALNMVGGDFFRVLSIPLRSGRVLEERDDAMAEPVVVISSSAAERYFPDVDPIGRRIALSAGWPDDGRYARVVGVVGDTIVGSLEGAAEPVVYVPIAQFHYSDNFVVLRGVAGQDSSLLRPLLEAAVRDAGAGVVAFDVATMDERFGALTARRRLVGILLAGLAVVSLALAGAGVYAVFALLVQRRRREFGVRLALGAEPRDLRRGVTLEGLRVSAGFALAGAAFGGVLVSHFAPVVPGYAMDTPMPWVSAVVLTIGAAALACWLPARDAARTPPMATLNSD